MTANERTALTTALTNASRGLNPPPIARLRAAAEHVIKRTQPDQVILFGSAARGEFGEHSDFDFLVLRRAPDRTPPDNAEKWTHPETGDSIDIIFEDPDAAPTNRWLAGTVEAAVFAVGATIYPAGDQVPIPTLRDSGVDPEDAMKEGKYERHKALDMARRCKSNFSNAEDAVKPDNEDWHTGCQRLQECFEKGLKALMIAHGRPFKYTHEIRSLLNDVRGTNVQENPPGLDGFNAADADLKILSRYGTGGGYDAAQGAADPKRLFEKFHPAAAEFAAYVQTRVPGLLDEHARRRRETPSKNRGPAR